MNKYPQKVGGLKFCELENLVRKLMKVGVVT